MGMAGNEHGPGDELRRVDEMDIHGRVISNFISPPYSLYKVLLVPLP